MTIINQIKSKVKALVGFLNYSVSMGGQDRLLVIKTAEVTLVTGGHPSLFGSQIITETPGLYLWQELANEIQHS